jgi:hypothetical protein
VHPIGRGVTALVGTGLVLLGGTGCGPRVTEFNITDHRAAGPAEQYFERFDECFYCVDHNGNMDIVACRHSPATGDASDTITQVLHIRQLWSAVPGRTFVEETMINATISYLIVGPTGGASFDGGGFVTFNENRDGTEIRGRLESSALTPQRGLGDEADLFSRASVSGTFVARRHKAKVLRILHEMQRLVGPLPPYRPPPGNPELR